MNYIYKITNIINGKLYIGKTGKTIEERFQDHKRASKAPYVNRPLYDAMNKYGYEYFIIEEVECCKNDKEASIREMYWIATMIPIGMDTMLHLVVMELQHLI